MTFLRGLWSERWTALAFLLLLLLYAYGVDVEAWR